MSSTTFSNQPSTKHSSENTSDFTELYYDVIVLGAGAAGYMAAITAGYRGLSVLILEKSNKPGKKILMSGGGRCNFTNRDTRPDNFLSANPYFCISALKQYSQWDFIDLVERHNLAYHEKKLGQLFCDNSSKDILDILQQEAGWAQVKVQLKTDIQQVEKITDTGNDSFLLTDGRQKYRCKRLIIATGGLSIPTLGGSGFGYELAQQFGHTIRPLRAGLVPFTLSDKNAELCQALSGVSFESEVSTSTAQTPHSASTYQFREASLLTHRGVSGPAMLQISSYWQAGETVNINLLPDLSIKALIQLTRVSRPKIKLRTLLTEHLPKRLVGEFESRYWPDIAEKNISDLSNQALNMLEKTLHEWTLKPSGTEGYRTAEVTLGGVDTHEVSSKTMESLKVKNLFFVGEVLDVTGWLGGYNFQWAWSSGYVAGSHC